MHTRSAPYSPVRPSSYRPEWQPNPNHQIPAAPIVDRHPDETATAHPAPPPVRAPVQSRTFRRRAAEHKTHQSRNIQETPTARPRRGYGQSFVESIQTNTASGEFFLHLESTLHVHARSLLLQDQSRPRHRI